MNLQLEAMVLGMPHVVGHPNRLPFRGMLTLVGAASQRPPSGAQGHRVKLASKATEAAIPSLLGMALDYSPTMDGHDVRRKIGIITDAEIQGASAGTTGGAAKLEIGGFLYARDFPDVVKEMRAGERALGMSYEIANAWVPDSQAAVWTVTKFTFTGAAVLLRDKAAYPETWIRFEETAGVLRRTPSWQRVSAMSWL